MQTVDSLVDSAYLHKTNKAKVMDKLGQNYSHTVSAAGIHLKALNM